MSRMCLKTRDGKHVIGNKWWKSNSNQLTVF